MRGALVKNRISTTQSFGYAATGPSITIRLQSKASGCISARRRLSARERIRVDKEANHLQVFWERKNHADSENVAGRHFELLCMDDHTKLGAGSSRPTPAVAHRLSQYVVDDGAAWMAKEIGGFCQRAWT
jgi:hypothetical protein